MSFSGRGGISAAPFGRLPDGREATLYTLTNANGLCVKISDYGGVVSELHVPDRHGRLADICLGFDTVEPYAGRSEYFGALIGRVGNRIGGASFLLDGERVMLPANDGPNHLHGGADGFHKVLWRARPVRGSEGVGLALTHTSIDGEQGYPGTLEVEATYMLGDDNTLSLRFSASADRPTPVNLTHHGYFNLAGGGDILGHELVIAANAYTPVGPGLIPTGRIADVADTPFDFRVAHTIGARIDQAHAQLALAGGYDHNYVLKPGAPGQLRLAARAHDPASGRVLELFTDAHGLQFYSGNFLDGSLSAKGRQYARHGGFCLEPQAFPDALNQAGFGDIVLRPGQRYRSEMRWHFFVAA